MHHQAYNTFNPIVTSRPLSSQYAPAYTTRPATHATTRSSSTTEFKGSTNPSEDWTKISDLAERRRIQNRIAQRNYRKKLKRRLEDLERRAQSRSLSPNGDDTDGRSTRESSTENLNASSTITTSPTTSTVSALTSAAVTSPSTVHTSPVTSTYEYTAPAYSTTSSTTLYPSQYKTVGYASSSISPTSTYVTSPLDYSQGSNAGYIYAPYDTTPAASQADMSVIDPNFILPLPTVSSSTSRIPGVMRTGGMYDIDHSVSALSTYNLLGNSYDIQDPYFPGGISSNYYNLDHLSPPQLLNTPTHYSTSQRN